MIAETLLQAGVGATVVFMIVLIEGALRRGYNPLYHTGSELELADRGCLNDVGTAGRSYFGGPTEANACPTVDRPTPMSCAT